MKLKILRIEILNGKRAELKEKVGILINKKDMAGFRESMRKKHSLGEKTEIFITYKETAK